MNFAVFDTIGLEEPQMGVNGSLKVIEKAYELVIKLGAAGGIHLLLFCMRAGEITATTQSNYRLFSECLCSTKVPVALVFTGLGKETEMEDWWVRHKTRIEHYGIKSNGHACITAVQDDTPGEDLKYTESQRKIRELLKTCALQNEDFSLEPHPLSARLGRGLRGFIEKHRNPKRRGVMGVLTHRCKLDLETARRIASMIEKGDAETKDENQDEQGEIKEHEGRSNPGHVKDEVGDVKNTAEVDPRSANLPRGKDKSGIASENGARDRTPATPHGDGEAGPHTVGLEKKDGGKPRMIGSGVDESLVVVEQVRPERVDRKRKSGAALAVRPSGPVQEISGK
ncbi:hypothetical protein JVT61DRAFT_13767 [Boletus reticuloceps]|uniref:Uncharacterized protein n=1 Tax=Boletus reticuloceps TaxID=495285 RepID=A0A8I2YRN4_9AGAM|nr:hypothetical protein JVT61DRAFT_13767 [Boletus reticuloceps]